MILETVNSLDISFFNISSERIESSLAIILLGVLMDNIRSFDEYSILRPRSPNPNSLFNKLDIVSVIFTKSDLLSDKIFFLLLNFWDKFLNTYLLYRINSLMALSGRSVI